jgi:hypothetical protein
VVGFLGLLRARVRCQVGLVLLANTFHQPRPQGARGRLRFLSLGHPAPVTRDASGNSQPRGRQPAIGL